MRGGQVAIEYLILISIIILIMMPLVIVYYNQTNEFTDRTAAALGDRATKEIVKAADSVYYLGAPSSRTITVELPRNIKELTITGNSISFLMDAAGGDYDEIAWSAANLTGTFSTTPGPHILTITAQLDGTVAISE